MLALTLSHTLHLCIAHYALIESSSVSVQCVDVCSYSVLSTPIQTCNKSTNSQVQVHYPRVRVKVRVRLKRESPSPLPSSPSPLHSSPSPNPKEHLVGANPPG